MMHLIISPFTPSKVCKCSIDDVKFAYNFYNKDLNISHSFQEESELWRTKWKTEKNIPKIQLETLQYCPEDIFLLPFCQSLQLQLKEDSQV